MIPKTHQVPNAPSLQTVWQLILVCHTTNYSLPPAAPSWCPRSPLDPPHPHILLNISLRSRSVESHPLNRCEPCVFCRCPLGARTCGTTGLHSTRAAKYGEEISLLRVHIWSCDTCPDRRTWYPAAVDRLLNQHISSIPSLHPMDSSLFILPIAFATSMEVLQKPITFSHLFMIKHGILDQVED